MFASKITIFGLIWQNAFFESGSPWGKPAFSEPEHKRHTCGTCACPTIATSGFARMSPRHPCIAATWQIEAKTIGTWNLSLKMQSTWQARTNQHYSAICPQTKRRKRDGAILRLLAEKGFLVTSRFTYVTIFLFNCLTKAWKLRKDMTTMKIN